MSTTTTETPPAGSGASAPVSAPAAAQPKPPEAGAAAARTVFPVVLAVSVIHMLNDSMQAVVPAILPALKGALTLTYTQIGFVIFALNMTSSVLQPVIGMYSDRKPSPYMLPLGMLMSLFGMAGIALAPNYALLLLSVVLVGLGSAVFHPEGSKVVYLAAGGRRGLAQSIYQVGGNGGSSLQPMMTKYLFLPFGQIAALWFTAVAALAFIVSWAVSRWYKGNMHLRKPKPSRAGAAKGAGGAAEAQAQPGGGAASYVWLGMGLLILLTFARSTYHAAILNYYQYFYAEKYASTIEAAQLPLFLFGVIGVVGTLVGGPLADRFGSKRVIFGSMAGAAPFAMLLPYVGEAWVIPIMFVVGFILMLGFSVVVVYAQLLMPNHIGTASGLIVGLAFGMGALGAVALGYFIDMFGLQPVFVAASLLPLIGIVTFKLPDLSKQ
ncbi:MFS transporter [Paenibacillus sp.]|uniref:MFS transporter n=1 Tax=Paenibacillus sp. TaxID=58172 RepID=UPI002D320E3B|nr:MFS transporter [Paenibacillus sp.]HZG86498.1 MFS transporter [Paenibacillus sp.]